jgi:hypothetical protein
MEITLTANGKSITLNAMDLYSALQNPRNDSHLMLARQRIRHSVMRELGIESHRVMPMIRAALRANGINL